jgi:Conserved hypothetical ATP binding protein
MEYLEEALDDWLAEELEGFGEDDYLVFDCPGALSCPVISCSGSLANNRFRATCSSHLL